jgi:hypothetical protein
VTEPRSYSISVRLRRSTVEEGYVKVPVTGEVMSPPTPVTHVGIDSGGTRTTVRIAGDSHAPHTIHVAESLSGALEPRQFRPCLDSIFAAAVVRF